MNEVENNIKEYEMAYLLTPEIPEDRIDSEIAELKKLIVDGNGLVNQLGMPERRSLAYPVKKQNHAYFGVVYFDIEPEGLDKIKKALALHKKIIRYLILRKPVESARKKTETKQPSASQIPEQSFDQRLESLLKS